MKRKIYFIVTSIIGIVGSIYCIINAQNIINNSLDNVKEVYSMFPLDFQERVINALTNGGAFIIRSMSLLIIIFSIIIIINSVKNQIENKKTTFIVLSIISCLISELAIMQLMYFISIIVSITIKGNSIKTKNEIPKLEHKVNSKLEKIYASILLVIYFSQLIWARFIPNSFVISITIEILFYLVMLVLSILIFKNDLKRDLKLFKENVAAYFKYIIPRYLIGIIIFIIVNLISILINKKATSINQQTLESLPNWYILPLAIIWAPIVEEIIFRGSIRRLINNKKLFIIISAFVFGFMHAINEPSIFSMIITTLPYATLGAILAYIYCKTDNLCSNMIVHFIHNTLSSILTLFL